MAFKSYNSYFAYFILSDLSIVTNIKKNSGKLSWDLLNRRISILGMEILLLKNNNNKRHEEKEQDKLFLHPGTSSELFQKYQQ